MKKDLITDVEMKSIEDDLLEYLMMSLRTSAGVTEGNVSSGVHMQICSKGQYQFHAHFVCEYL